MEITLNISELEALLADALKLPVQHLTLREEDQTVRFQTALLRPPPALEEEPVEADSVPCTEVGEVRVYTPDGDVYMRPRSQADANIPPGEPIEVFGGPLVG